MCITLHQHWFFFSVLSLRHTECCCPSAPPHTHTSHFYYWKKCRKSKYFSVCLLSVMFMSMMEACTNPHSGLQVTSHYCKNCWSLFLVLYLVINNVNVKHSCFIRFSFNITCWFTVSVYAFKNVMLRQLFFFNFAFLVYLLSYLLLLWMRLLIFEVHLFSCNKVNILEFVCFLLNCCFRYLKVHIMMTINNLLSNFEASSLIFYFLKSNAIFILV